MNSIYVEYLGSFASAFFVLLLLEILMKMLFRTPVKIYSRFIGAVVLSFFTILHDHFLFETPQYIGLMFFSVVVWIFLDSILLPKKEKNNEHDCQQD